MSSENLNNLSIEELKKLVKKKNEDVKKLEKKEEKLLKKNRVSKRKVKSKVKPKAKLKTKKQKIKTFDDYFQECIKNKVIPKDTLPYFKEALLRAMKEYDLGIKQKKSSFRNKVKKYFIDGKPGLLPFQFFAEKEDLIKDFLMNQRGIKVRMTLVCSIYRYKYINGGKDILEVTNKMKFLSNIHINYEKTDVGELLNRMIEKITEKISVVIEDKSNWKVKEVITLEIHPANYKPMKGESYIPLPEFIMRKKATLNMENKDDKCFLWSILRFLHPVKKMEQEYMT